MCKKLPSSGQPWSLFSLGGQNQPRNSPHAAPTPGVTMYTSGIKNNQEYSLGASQHAILALTTIAATNIITFWRKLDGGKTNFSLHHGQVRSPPICNSLIRIGWPQLGQHGTISYLVLNIAWAKNATDTSFQKCHTPDGFSRQSKS